MDIRQLLSQGYQAADRFLPFDTLLDPMFNPPPRRPMPQDVGATPNMQSRFVPQVPQVAGAPAPMPQSAPGPAPMTVPKRGGGFGRTLMEFIDPAFNDRADKRAAAEANQAQRGQLFQFAQSVITDPREWLIFQTDPEAWAKARVTGYETRMAGEGSAIFGPGGEVEAFNPRYVQSGDETLQTGLTPQGGTLQSVYTRAPTFGETTDRQRLEFDMRKPQIVTASPGQDVVAVTPAGPNLDESTARNVIGSLFPDAKITSGMRTPERNAAVGGAPNSFHMRGQALDFVKPPGMTFEQIKQSMAAQGLPVTELIDEGDHIHWAWGGKSQPSAQVVASGSPKPTYRVASKDEVARVGLDPSVSYQVSPEGEFKPVQTGGLTPQQIAKDSVQLRKEFNALPDVKDFNNVATSFNVIKRLSSQPPTAAGDLSLIFAYMKMLDPGSVVREAEFANAQNTAGVPDQVWNAFEKAKSGQRLNPKQRAEFTRQAENLYTSYRERYDEVTGQYKSYAQQSGLDPNIITPRAEQKVAAPKKTSPANPSDALKPGAKMLAEGGRPLTRDQVARLPKGARFMGTDGREYVKQ